MGVVTALRTGYASISAYTTQGEILNCLVEVRSDIGEVTLNAGDLALEQIGTQKPLHASVAVQNPSAVQLSWVSANPEIATVDQSGVVTAVADGMTEITVYTPDGRSDSCQVYVGSSVAEFEKVDTIRTVAVVGGVAVLVTIAIIASAAQ